MNVTTRRLLTVAAVLGTASSLTLSPASAETFTDAETCSFAETSGGWRYSCVDWVEADYSANHTHAATVFTETGYAGKKLRIYKLGGACTSSYSDIEFRADFPPGVFGSPDWEDNVESLRTFNQCDIKLFWNPHPDTSPQSVWIDDSSNLNTLSLDWNNKANWFRIS